MPVLHIVADPPPESRVHMTVAPLPRIEVFFEDPAIVTTLPPTERCCLCRDLAFALAELFSGRRDRAVVETMGPGRLDVGLERDGEVVRVTVLRPGEHAQVVQHGRPVAAEIARVTLLDWLASVSGHDEDGPLGRGLALAAAQLREVVLSPPSSYGRCRTVEVSTRTGWAAGDGMWMQARTAIRATRADPGGAVSRADLHALLFRGDVTVAIRNAELRVRGVHVFLFAEQLVALAGVVARARSERRSVVRRVLAGGASCGVQLDTLGSATLLLAETQGRAPASPRLPTVSAEQLVHAIGRFGHELAVQIVAADPSQSHNLRLSAFRDASEALLELRASQRSPSPQLNGAPESYRAFAESSPRRTPPPMRRERGRLRFTESWRATVPAIDLRSVLLIGDRLLVGSSREVACIERTHGELLWRRDERRAVSVATPVGLARLAPDGHLTLLDYDDGEDKLCLKLSPCVGGSASGAVVNATGLPHMLLLGEGNTSVVAVDLDTQQIRWRHALHKRHVLRMRRAGKLMVVCTGDDRLSALDLLSGEIVWQHFGPNRYAQKVDLDGDTLFALSTERVQGGGEAALECIDTFTGALRYSRRLPRPIHPLGPPVITGDTVIVVDRHQGRLGVIGLHRDTGEVVFDLPGGLCSSGGAWLVVDDLLIANSESGELVALDCRDGSTRYRHVLATWQRAGGGPDVPLSLQPLLRSGALFVPQSEVYVVRPHDGALLGQLPPDLVPDVMRVDERCGVYIAESSGYIGAYAAEPTLTLVSAVE